MSRQPEKRKTIESRSVANVIPKKKSNPESPFPFVDKRPDAIMQRKLQTMANETNQTKQVARLQAMADDYSLFQKQPIQRKENRTGLPDRLKSGIENLSGYAMDDVSVHYNSSKPAQLNAHAYAKGSEIHVATGQEKYLPHEAWHVVQQKQGRVKPTLQMKGGISVNNNESLEKEADVMGGKALQFTRTIGGNEEGKSENAGASDRIATASAPIVFQCQLTNRNDQEAYDLDMSDKRIAILDSEGAERGFVDFFEADGKFYLKTINTKSGKGPKGSGAILVYQVAARAMSKFNRVTVTNATPEETGFYLHMGFEPDPEFLQKLQSSGMEQGKIDQMKFTTLSADVNKLLDSAGASMVKNWNEEGWDERGVYAGEHPEHGSMFHIPL